MRKKKKEKVQGWQIFHAYDIPAAAHPPTLTQESRGGDYEDGSPDRIMREADMSKKNILMLYFMKNGFKSRILKNGTLI